MAAKYKVIAQELREQILSSQSIKPCKLSTEQELCLRYQASRQTIRQALHTLEEEKLITRRQGSGAYTIPQTEYLRQTKIVLMISEDNEYTYPGLISDIQAALRIQGLILSVFITKNDINTERTILSELLDQSVSVLIVEGIQPAFSNPNIDLYEKFQLSGTQVIFINHNYTEVSNTAFVCSDDITGGRLLGDHLIAGNLRKPAVILPDFLENAKLRFYGLQTAYRDANLPIPQQDIFWYTQNDIHTLRLRQDTGFITQAIRRLASKCDCFFCYNDEISYWLIKELSFAGFSVPEQISVVSFDNSYFCTISHPPITSLGHPVHEPGYTIAGMVIDTLHGQKLENKTLPWKLFPRGSVINTNYF